MLWPLGRYILSSFDIFYDTLGIFCRHLVNRIKKNLITLLITICK
jgi:hypothetical protein